ncbi:hypothetical protein H8A99_28680 [Bradyrhizobium sp. Arg68]|uniref:hypothetical protein n=1 Tax=Bradyrhizobium ivorense TaxID=2511166 RepID=UPI001E560D18|nr:hypothetical protein [Bradyrhizobium ivorense]MCC8940327.1 hypothetical protein [Bradyrhizobium ivorense]
MQFREQARKIQCIRSTYNPATKRSDSSVVASFDRYADKIPSDLPELTEAERAELATWFEARQAAKAASMNTWRAQYGGRALAELATAIQTTGAELTPDQAAAIWQGIEAVKKALRKHGHRRVKAVQPAKPEPSADLFQQPVVRGRKRSSAK